MCSKMSSQQVRCNDRARCRSAWFDQTLASSFLDASSENPFMFETLKNALSRCSSRKTWPQNSQHSLQTLRIPRKRLKDIQEDTSKKNNLLISG